MPGPLAGPARASPEARTLEIRDLRVTYSESESPVLNGVDLVAPPGLTALIGPSGSGKTTLFRAIAGTVERAAGTITLDGRSTERDSRIGYIYQDFRLVDFLDVLENLELAREMNHRPRDADLCRTLLDDVGLGGFATRRPRTLSGGQQQRVAIARALAIEPDLLLADEPTGALDRRNSDAVADLLQDLGEESSIPILMATHDMRLAQAARHAYGLDGEGNLSPVAVAA